MTSSDSGDSGDLWQRHYRAASKRRRARGWHRREETNPRHGTGPTSRRIRFYVAAAVIFIALTAVALALPR